jgi:serine/threonine-protein phosphatase PGAM5
MMKGAEDNFGPCTVKALRVSGLARARETADIIASHLPGIVVEDPDPLMNEGRCVFSTLLAPYSFALCAGCSVFQRRYFFFCRPCHTIPGGQASEKLIELTDSHHPRIEDAYRKYFYRAPLPEANPDEKHEFEVIVCHANVIRYWMCRALQLPPETWLRFCPFNCSLTYLTIRPTGTVSCRMLGDIGHLPYDMSTFSQHHGYTW